MEEYIVNNKKYQIIKLLGHGKGGYSYLAKYEDTFVVLKKIHHEPCDYYQFGNKIDAEYHDYQTLLEVGINIPKMIDIDKEQEIIIKEYIEGKTIDNLIKSGVPIDEYIPQVIEMSERAKKHNINIDYYPTNFVVNKGRLYYIDYECNQYDPKWDYINWGQQYWVKSK